MQKTTNKENRSRTARDLIETVFRHKIKVASFFLASVMATLIVLSSSLPSYTSISKLIIHRGRESAFLDPTTAGGEAFPLYKEWENEINSELEILKSRELVLQIIEKLGPSAFLADPPNSSSGKLGWLRAALKPARKFIQEQLDKLSPAPQPGQPTSVQTQIHNIIQMMDKQLNIEAQPKSDIIAVTYTANSPELARKVVTDLISTYLQRRIDLQNDPGTLQFFSEQTELLLNELTKNETRLLAIKDAAGIVSLEDDRHTLQTTIEATKTKQLQVQSSLAAASARVGTIRTTLTPKATTKLASQSGTHLDLERYKELQTSLLQEEATVSGLVAEEQEMDRQLYRLQTELEKINKLEPEIRRLLREHGLLEEKYRKYSTNKEQARISQELESKKSYNVSIVQHATLPGKANPSGKLLKLIASLFLGMAGAIAIAFGADILDPTLHSATDITDRLDLTTLIELPLTRRGQLNAKPPTPKKHKRPHRQQVVKSEQASDNDYFQELYFRLLALRPTQVKGPLVIGLTSSTNGEGVSTITRKLAEALSCDGRYPNILLLDATPESRPSSPAEQQAGCPFTTRSVLENKKYTSAENSHACTSALIEILNEARKESFEIILIDIPPLNQGGYAIRLSAASDLVGLVVDSDRTPWRSVKWAADLLNNADTNLCGVILNRQHYKMPKWLYLKL